MSPFCGRVCCSRGKVRQKKQYIPRTISAPSLTCDRQGPYANAVLRFQIDFPDEYPHTPPTVTFLSDVFHPLVTPLTTHSHSSRDTGAEPASAADRDRLPPGGLSLRHGFPEWYEATGDGAENKRTDATDAGQAAGATRSHDGRTKQPPLTVEILQYIRIVFDTDAVLDSIPLEAAANAGAWHAWKSYRAKVLGGRAASPLNGYSRGANDATGRSMSPRQQQPGGARRPGEWNWLGVWEDRVKKSIQASNSEQSLYGGDGKDVVCFSKMDRDAVEQIMPFSQKDLFT